MKMRLHSLACLVLVLTSCGGKVVFHGQAAMAPPVLDQQAASKGPDAGDAPPMAVHPADEPKFVERSILTKQHSGILVHWVEATDESGIASYDFTLTDSSGKVVQSKSLDLGAGAGHTRDVTIDTDLPEGKYSLQIGSIFAPNYESSSKPDQIPLVIDLTPPHVALFLGTDFTGDSCAKAPATHDAVSTRLAPFAFCAQDGAQGAGIKAVCLVPGNKDLSSMPADGDACWKSPKDLSTLIFLSNGSNAYTLFARDNVLNAAASSGSIALNRGLPPSLDIQLPIASSLTAAPWHAGDKKVVQWHVTDDDTDYKDIKIIIKLVQSNDSSNFKNLACNFKNSPLWQQCPSPTIEASPDITNGSDANVGMYSFTVPSDWDVSKTYIITITAIDKFGNASIVSTPEINATWEVIAGRTYTGLGGSGVTIQTAQQSGNSDMIALDKHGQLFNSMLNYKINVFDYRSCRMFRSSASDIRPEDCSDAMIAPYNLNYPWQYDSTRDVFYSKAVAAGVVYLVEIDFNAKTVKTIFGGSGKTPLASGSVGSGATSMQFSPQVINTIDQLNPSISFEETSGKLFFMHSNQIYAIDVANQSYALHYLLGKVGGTDFPTDTAAGTTVAQRDIGLPAYAGTNPFIVLPDRRIFISSSRIMPTTPGGGLYGIQYLVDRVTDNADAPASLMVVTPDGGDSTKHAVTTNDCFNRQYVYNKSENRLYTQCAWVGHVYMNVPAAGSAAASYRWSALQTSYAAFGASIATAPAAFWAGWIAYMGSSQLFYINDYTGTINDLDFHDTANASSSPIVGFSVGQEGDQLALNRRLDQPMDLFVDSTGGILFHDFYNLQRVTIDKSNSANNSIKTLVSNYPRFGMRYDSSSNKVYQINLGAGSGGTGLNLQIYNLDNLSAAPTYVIPSSPATPYYNYDLQFGVGNVFTTPHFSFLTSAYNAKLSKVYRSFLGYAGSGVSGITNLTASDYYVLGLTAADFTKSGDTPCTSVPCAQGTPVGNVYSGSTYRLPNPSGRIEWHSPSSAMAFDGTDQNIYTCLNDSFVKVNIASDKITKFTASSGGTTINCGQQYSVFEYIDGNIYFHGRNSSGIYGIYCMNTSAIDTSGTAALTALPTKAALYPSFYGGYAIDAANKKVYYTDRSGNRVLSNALTTTFGAQCVPN